MLSPEGKHFKGGLRVDEESGQLVNNLDENLINPSFVIEQ